jgi:hypothetical protein
MKPMLQKDLWIMSVEQLGDGAGAFGYFGFKSGVWAYISAGR